MSTNGETTAASAEQFESAFAEAVVAYVAAEETGDRFIAAEALREADYAIDSAVLRNTRLRAAWDSYVSTLPSH